MGDQVIRKVSTTARVQIRAEDLVGRIGGEEFVCILSGVEGGEARVLAERLCSWIAEATLRDGPAVTISIGLAIVARGRQRWKR